MVGTESALEDSQGDLVASRSKLGKVFRSKGSRHTPVQQALNPVGLKHLGFQGERGGHSIIKLRSEPFEA